MKTMLRKRSGKKLNSQASSKKAKMDMGPKRVPTSNVPTKGKIKKLNYKTKKAGFA